MKNFFILILLTFCFISSQASAATKISDLTDAGTLVGTEKTIVSKSGDTSQSYSTTIDAIKTFLFGSTGQTGLDTAIKSGVGPAAPLVVQCVGGGDESALTSAATSAYSRKSAILVPHGCQMNNQFKPTSGTYTNLFGVGGAPVEVNTMGTALPYLRVNSASINSSAPGKTAIDMNATRQMAIKDLNIRGDSNDTVASLIGNSVQNGTCCASNLLHILNSSLTNSHTLIGCQVDYATGNCVSGSYTAPNTLIRATKSQFSNFKTAISLNFSDLQLYNSELTAGRVGIMPQYGGGDNMVGQNRFEFLTRSVAMNELGTGYPNNSWFNSNTFTHNYDTDIEFGHDDGWMANSNVFDLQQAGNVVNNGSFAYDNDWTKGTGWAIGSGVATASSTSAALSQQFANIMKGYTYTVTYDLTVTGGTITPTVGGVVGTTRATSGSYSENILATTNKLGIVFNTSGFSGTIDNITATPVEGSPAIVVGGDGVGAATHVILDGNGVFGSSRLRYGVDLQGTADDYIYVTGIYKGSNMQKAVNYGNETPSHMVEDTLGAGASGWTGQHAERGRPFGIGTLSPRSTVALDLYGSDNVSKPLGLSRGTTAQRPTCDSNMVGGIRYNTTLGQVESCGANGWQIGTASASGAYNIGNSGTAFTITLANGLSQYVTLTGNATITMPTVVAGGGFDITILTGAGGFTPTFSGAKWEEGVVPTFTTTASAKDRVGCLPSYDLTVWECAARMDIK